MKFTILPSEVYTSFYYIDTSSYQVYMTSYKTLQFFQLKFTLCLT